MNNISKSYGSKQVLNSLSPCFDIGINAVLGPNGAGKSTLINIICGILKADSGDVVWNGENIYSKKCSMVSELGYIPQSIAMYPDFCEDEYLFYISALKKIPVERRRREVMRVLKTVGLSKYHSCKIKTLSEGMKRRLLIAQALLGDPKLLIMDEPTAGLDPGQRIAFKNLMSSLSESRIIIVATHIVPDVENIADKIMFLKKGSILTYDYDESAKGLKNIMTPLEQEYYDVFDIEESIVGI